MNYREVSITLPSEHAEALAWRLTERGLPGLVVDERRPDEAERTTATLRAYLPEVEGAFSPRELRAAVCEELADLDEAATFDVSVRTMPEEDWATSWQQYWHVQRIGDRLVVRPSWEAFEAGPGDLVITLDPKQAFGTGTHPTTRLCMRMLERLAAEGPLGTVFDVGAGSGILAISALLLGASRAVAVDTDPIAVAAAEENAELNQVADRMENRVGSAADLVGHANVVCANILADVIIEIAADLQAHTIVGGALVASGIIARRSDDVAAALTAHGFEVVRRDDEGDWVGLLAIRRS
jgi:ribosomal protein L11 methyltransferase